ncbi:Response_reg domain-containing protein/Myb_DNA-binding domain-containing protein [Cephalotus follicularis]|uniref:Response_reg domain-containing protein/Myb_DNA-binding domain-containing protein n=1 Tax=Cephalotus follicularis TaxID=3775 RepID=A0A1Q3AMZ6_CEPFO|nr:Response_reg domain-containing protein/Myb_DNA-binding domain-containing protein [Cephalotus follicularis]
MDTHGEKTKDRVVDTFPVGMRVLLLDDDRICIKIVTKMLKDCQYEVTISRRAQEALIMLREDKNRFDIVLTDLHMPDMDGLKLLEILGLEMGLPVVMMSSDDGEQVIMKGIIYGACDYLVKPVRKEAIKYLWQHVIRKKSNDFKEIGELGSVDDMVVKLIKQCDINHAYNVTARNNENTKSSKKRKDDDDDGGETTGIALYREKKQRFHWTVELNEKFVTAVTQLGRDKAVPKKILEVMQEMNVAGITRENIASHLQVKEYILAKNVSEATVNLRLLNVALLCRNTGCIFKSIIVTFHGGRSKKSKNQYLRNLRY